MLILIQDPLWVEQAKKRLTSLFENKPLDRISFFYNIVDDEKTLKESLSDKSIWEDLGERLTNNEKDLKAQLDDIQKRLQYNCWDDNILALLPYVGVGTVASVFGCKTVFPRNENPWTKPVAFSSEDIYKLRINLEEAEAFNMALEKIRHFKEVVKDKIPIKLPDIQGPLDSASIVMDYSQFLLTLVENPKAAHLLLEMVTEAIIKVVRRVQKEMLVEWGASHGLWIPRGLWISDDLLAVLSPQLFKEYGVKYNSILSKEFNGILVHTCGDFRHNIPNILEIENIMGINYGDLSILDVQPMTKGQVVLNSPWILKSKSFEELINIESPADLMGMREEDLEHIHLLQSDRVLLNITCNQTMNYTCFYQKIIEKLNLFRIPPVTA